MRDEQARRAGKTSGERSQWRRGVGWRQGPERKHLEGQGRGLVLTQLTHQRGQSGARAGRQAPLLVLEDAEAIPRLSGKPTVLRYECCHGQRMRARWHVLHSCYPTPSPVLRNGGRRM